MGAFRSDSQEFLDSTHWSALKSFHSFTQFDLFDWKKIIVEGLTTHLMENIKRRLWHFVQMAQMESRMVIAGKENRYIEGKSISHSPYET